MASTDLNKILICFLATEIDKMLLKEMIHPLYRQLRRELSIRFVNLFYRSLDKSNLHPTEVDQN